MTSMKVKLDVLCEALLKSDFLYEKYCLRHLPNFSLQVDMFKRGGKSDWQQLVDKIENKRKMFADLLNENEGELLMFTSCFQPV